MLEKQNNRCSVCRCEFDLSRLATTPHIEHCHETKCVRGLTCRKCNTGLGMFNDDPVLLSAALEYLQTANYVILS
jgi:hypothetical protein